MFFKKIAYMFLASATIAQGEPTSQLFPTPNQDEHNPLTKTILNESRDNVQPSVQQTEVKDSADDFSLQTTSEQDTVTLRATPENKSFSNVRVYNTLHTKDLYIEGTTVIGSNLKVNQDTVINGNLTVDGTISGSGAGNVSGPGSSTPNAVARFVDGSGTAITDSPVLIDNAGNISGINNLAVTGNLTGVQDAQLLNNLTVGQDVTIGDDLTVSGTLFINEIANFAPGSEGVIWPTNAGSIGQFLGITAPGILGYSTPTGAGDVTATAAFTSPAPNNKIVVTDFSNGAKNIVQSNVTLDTSNNISGVATLGATTINATTVTAPTLNGNATTATNAANVGTQTALQVQTATIAANLATNAGTANRIVLRDGTGDGGFSAGAITATQFNGPLSGTVTGALIGNAATATSANTFSTSLVGDVTGGHNGSNTVVGSINNGAMSAGTIITGVNLANNSTPNNTLGTIVRRNPTDGGFTAGPITASLIGNATTATQAQHAFRSDYTWSFTGQLAGDVTGPQNTTVVAFVGGVPASIIAAGSTLASTATSTNIFGTLVLRNPADGSFASGPITASLLGNASSATNATYFTTSLSGDLIGGDYGSTTTVLTVGGKTRTEIATSVDDTQAATPNNTPADYDKIVRRDGSGNFSATTITANLIGNVTGNLTGLASNATNAVTATNFSGSLAGDVTGNQGSTTVAKVGGQLAADVALATNAVNVLATDAETPNTLVKRDGSGNFSGETITAETGFIGDLTGDVTGSADSATSAVMSTTSQWFSQNLAGDVTGSQLTTYVNTIQGTSAATVLAGAALANAATDANTPNFLVKRDSSGNFITNMITLEGSVNADTDAATKAYVDSVAGSGIEPKTPVIATSVVNTPTSTLLNLIDGVTLNANDRVLLTQQNYLIDNGIWLAQSSDWIRPTDFALGTTAGQAYVLTTSGLSLAGTGWLCSTPLATIGTDTVTFIQFTSPGQTSAANVGSGIGLFKDKTGLTLNFKSLTSPNNFLTIAPSGANEVSFTVTARSDAIPYTLVSRDASGSFAGTLTGDASLNVLKAGDAMTGNLVMHNQSEIRWSQDTGTNYIGFKAPATGTFAYTVNLPGTAPTAGQFLQAVTDSTLTWTTIGAVPAITKTIYVSLEGNDSNDGSLSAPLRHVSAAVTKANAIPASLTNPVTISIGSGIFVETPPININVRGISIEGSTIASTILVSSSTTTNFFNVNSADVMFSNLILRTITTGSTATAIAITAPDFGRTRIDNVGISLFATGINYNGTYGLPLMYLENLQCTDIDTALAINDAQIAIRSSLLQGVQTGSPANTGMTLTGTSCHVAVFNTHFTNYDTSLIVSGQAHLRTLACNFELNNKSIFCSGGSTSEVLGCNFILNNATTVNITVSGANTVSSIIGCHIDGHDTSDTNQGLGILVTNQARGFLDSCSIKNATIGLQCGNSGDTIDTNMEANAISLIDTSTDIYQYGTSKLNFVAGSFHLNKVFIENSDNVNFAAFSGNGNAFLAFGTTQDEDTIAYKIANGQITPPTLSYKSNYYGYKGTSYINTNTDPTFSGMQSNQNNARQFVITGDRTKEAGISLISDSGNIGNPDNVRGWTINKLGTQAALAFTFTNNDTSGFPLRGPYTVMQLNGLDNQLEFPVATGSTLPTNDTAKLVWGSDTNLYRSAANTLKTDDNVVIGSLAPTAGIVHNDTTGLLSSSLLVNADVSATASIVDTKLATITTAGKVANSATTATSANDPDTIVLRDSSGNFAANLISASITGTALANVLKIGDTMTGNLVMANQSEIRWAQDTGTNYIGFKAPATGTFGYTVNLPGTPPAAGQFLQALDGSSLTWTVVDAPPAATKTYYVALNGSDSNDGSLSAPFRTVKYAVAQANALPASLTNPVTVSVGAGLFEEDLSLGSITINVDGISIKGSSLLSTIITTSNNYNDLFNITASNVQFSNLTLRDNSYPASTKTAIKMDTSGSGRSNFNTISISFFNTGFDMSRVSGTPASLFFENIESAGNGTVIALNNETALIRSSIFRGPIFGGAANTGITTTGSLCHTYIFNSYFSLFDTALSASNNAFLRVLGSNIENTTNGVIAESGGRSQLIGLNFVLNSDNSINVSASGNTTRVYLEGCLFDCEDASDVPQGTAIIVTDGAEIIANACTIEEAVVGIQCGTIGDTNTTSMLASGISIITTTTSIRQLGSSKLQFTGGSLNINTLDIADPTNVNIATFNANGEAHLAIGKVQDIPSKIYEIINNQGIELPHVMYEPNYYGYKGTVYHDTSDVPTFNATQAGMNNAHYFIVTEDNTKEAGISLISDTVMTGSPDNVRGWSITKTGTTADLVFTYTDNDPDGGMNNRGPYDIMRLNGLDNQVEFPTATGTLPTNLTAKLVWGNDTNLYRSDADMLKTDDNFIVGGSLTAGSTFLSTLTVGAGTATNPSLQFAGSTNTGLSAQTPNRLSFDTNSVEHMSIDSTGTVAINQFNVAGVVHNNASGQLSSSLIVNADITDFTITDTKLAIISTAGKVANSATTATELNNPDTIVLRDSSGNFAATVITAYLTGTASENILRSGDSMTGTFTVIAGSPTNPSLQFAGSTNTGFSAPTPNKLSFDTNGIEQASLDETAFITQVSMQVPYGSATEPSYTFSGDTNTGMYDKEANTLGFATNGIERMTIESTGTVNILGTLVLAAGTATEPSLKFTNGTNTGLSSPTANTISFDTNGVERISATDTSVTVTAATFILGTLMAKQSIQSETLTGNLASFTANDTTSILVFNTGASNRTITTFNPPSNPINGQLFTIMLGSQSTDGARTLTLTNNTNIQNPVTILSTQGGNMTGIVQGPAVTYIYLESAGALAGQWYRYSR